MYILKYTKIYNCNIDKNIIINICVNLSIPACIFYKNMYDNI